MPGLQSGLLRAAENETLETPDFDLILLPGIHGTGGLFEPFIAALPFSAQPRVMEYPVDEPLDYQQLLPRVLDALPPGPHLVLGESFSGPLAVMAAAARPGAVAGVILCGSFVCNPLRWVPPAAAGLLRPFMVRGLPMSLRLRTVLGEYGTPELAHRVRAANRRVHPRVQAVRARAVLRVNVSAELRELTVPVLYLAGSEDRLIRRHNAERIRTLRPDVEVVTLKAPHLILQVAPAAAARCVELFAQRCL